ARDTRASVHPSRREEHAFAWASPGAPPPGRAGPLWRARHSGGPSAAAARRPSPRATPCGIRTWISADAVAPQWLPPCVPSRRPDPRPLPSPARHPHPLPRTMKRDLELLSSREFDLVVVGGGVLGAFLAWRAARQGLSVA